MLVGTYCGKDARCDGHAKQFEQAHASLRRRVRAEVEMVMEVLPWNCTNASRTQLTSSLRSLGVWYGHGKGLKRGGTEV